MRSIRIGKDIQVRWHILTNGKPEPLDGRDLKLVLVSPIKGKTEKAFTTDGNTLLATISGTEQKHLGVYSLTLWENGGKEGQTAVDACEVFRLVAATCMECGTDEGLDTESVELEGDMEVATTVMAMPDAPKDGRMYGRKDGNWEEVEKGGTSAFFEGAVLVFAKGAVFEGGTLVIN